jgi:hypothetical protein
MTSSTVLTLLFVHEKHEMHEIGRCWIGGWTGFFTPSETFQNTDRYSKPYGTGSKPVPAFVIAHTVAIELGQAS